MGIYLTFVTLMEFYSLDSIQIGNFIIPICRYSSHVSLVKTALRSTSQSFMNKDSLIETWWDETLSKMTIRLRGNTPLAKVKPYSEADGKLYIEGPYIEGPYIEGPYIEGSELRPKP